MRKIVVGLTGGIGTGKSAALAAFRRLGAGTVCCDKVAHELSRPGRALQRSVVSAFGRGVLGPGGRLDRAKLARIAFAHPALRRRLEAVTHPHILRRAMRLVRRARRSVVVVDVPLLFEAGLEREFDVTMVVSAPARTALRRVLRRGGLSRAEAASRMRAQWPIRRKEALADLVAANRGSLRALQRDLAGTYQALRLIAGR